MSKSESSGIIKQVEFYIDDCFPSGRDQKMILGVSGGPDSMSLLYIFSKLDIKLTVVHCNYQLRGKDSNDDQKLVEDTASMWGYDTVSVRLDPEESGGNFQNWARVRRYRIFRDLKRELKADAIATAHHQDDQLETIIQKILRGSGLTAWQGMKVWNGELFRPLLDVSKANLLKFASSNHVPYRLDNSNEESTYARNFLRNGWFPILDDLFPGWRDNILKVPDRAKEHEAVVKSLINFLKTDDRSILRERLISMPSEVQKPLILQVLKSIDPSVTVSSGSLKNLGKLETLQTGKKLAVNDRWSLTRDRDRFIVTEEETPAASSSLIFKEDLEKSEVTIPRIAGPAPAASFVEPDDIPAEEEPAESVRLTLEVLDWDGHIRPEQLQLDADQISWPLRVREWKKGDSINPLGMEGNQNISDHLTNEKISVADKSSVKVAETDDEKICAVIFPPGSETGKPGTIAHWVRCTANTTSTLRISYKE